MLRPDAKDSVAAVSLRGVEISVGIDDFTPMIFFDAGGFWQMTLLSTEAACFAAAE
jgi:hypothetical protein